MREITKTIKIKMETCPKCKKEYNFSDWETPDKLCYGCAREETAIKVQETISPLIGAKIIAIKLDSSDAIHCITVRTKTPLEEYGTTIDIVCCCNNCWGDESAYMDYAQSE